MTGDARSLLAAAGDERDSHDENDDEPLGNLNGRFTWHLEASRLQAGPLTRSSVRL
jgi:hypothetical protein